MKKNHFKEKKTLSIIGLLNIVRKTFVDIAEKILKPIRTIKIEDCLMSALAMFGLKSVSLLAFDKQRLEPHVAHNLKTLYGIEQVPSDTHMRVVLDEIDPQFIRKCFLKVFNAAQRGKVLEKYKFLNNYLCLIDGSQIFHSEKVFCENCCKKNHKDGRITYYHQILGAVIASPYQKQVIPLCPEPIARPDGVTKNDCERNALHRLLKNIKEEHPRLKLTIVADALSANASVINELKSYDYNFIINVKPKGNSSLFAYAKGVTKTVKIQVDKNKYTFRYVNQIPINITKEAPLVNFIECQAEETKGKTITNKTFSWCTNFEITDKNCYKIMLGGRKRWAIENETFNTLKNQGYQFEHNFGHGNKNLHTVFAFLMMLAFLIDQLQEFSCGLFQKALNNRYCRKAFWENIKMLFFSYFVKSWQDMYKSIGLGFNVATLGFDTS